MKPGWYITLTDAEIEEATAVGHARQQNAEDERRRPGNNLDADWARSLQISILGALGERAGKALFDPIEWHAFKTGPLDDTPDLGKFIDIKTTPPRRNCWLTVKRGGVKSNWVYVLCEQCSRDLYRFAGWVWGRELAAVPLIEPVPGRPAHVIREDDRKDPMLRSIRELQAILHGDRG